MISQETACLQSEAKINYHIFQLKAVNEHRPGNTQFLGGLSALSFGLLITLTMLCAQPYIQANKSQQ